jgi:hypothetical protein
MTQVIFKYPLSLTPAQSIYLPVGAKILHFGNQGEIPTLWVEVDPDAPIELRYFHVVGTGHELPTNTKSVYIGTALFEGGVYVWHLYEVSP